MDPRRPPSRSTAFTAAQSRLPLALFAVWAGSVAALTLTPATLTPPLTLRTFLCIACGELDGSDLIRNWILFVPGGILGAAAFRTGWGLALPVLFTVTIEFLQIGVPGRDPRLQDLLLNTLGAYSGVLLLRRGLPSWGRRLVAAAAALAWLAPLVLLVPLTTRENPWGQWTPSFATTEHYQGRVLDASVGPIGVASGRHPDKPGLDAAITSRAPVLLRLIAGPHPSSWAPIFQIVDDRQQGILELGALGSDLILRGRNPARALKLDQPDVRWVGAMAGVDPGDTVAVRADRSHDSVCMSVDDRERCRVAPSLGDGWGHVLNLERPPRWFRGLLSVIWASTLGGLVGLTMGRGRVGVSAAAGLGLIGYSGSLISPDVSPSLVHAAVLITGAWAGAALRGPVLDLWRAHRPP